MPALIAVSSSSPRAKNSRIVPLLPAPVTLCQMAFCSLDSERLRWMNVGPVRLRSFFAALVADTLANYCNQPSVTLFSATSTTCK
jgi:hypothetical protein